MADLKKDTEKPVTTEGEGEKKVEVAPEVEQELSIEDGMSCHVQFQLPSCIWLSGSLTFTEILGNITVIGRAVSTMEPRYTTRVLRTLTTTRKKLDKDHMRNILNQAFPQGCTSFPSSCHEQLARTWVMEVCEWNELTTQPRLDNP